MAIPSYYDAAGVLTDGEAWVAIGSTVASSNVTSITITSTDDGQVGDFSQYMDLVAILCGQSRYTGGGGCTARLHLNGVETTANLYPTQVLRCDGSSVTAVKDDTSKWFDCAEWPSDTDNVLMLGAAIVHLFDINSGKYKSMLSHYAGDKDGSGYVGVNTANYLSQTPITSVTFKVRRGASSTLNLTDGSRFDLFGVLPRMVA